jgi:hypothetical protein
MKAKEFIVELKKESKPRNFVAKNASLAGKAGQHKDKKKAEKQGDVKHKKELATMESALSELSTEKLAQYKKAAGADAKKADADGNYSRGDKRFKGINQATNKQFDNDLKKHGVAEAGAAQTADPVAARVAAAPHGYNTDTGKPNPPPAKAAAKEPIVQATDDMEQRILDRMGKRFGLPPGSSADDVQAAQQSYLDKNDPAAAAQYKKNMANIDAGGTQADNAPVKLAPKPGQPGSAPNPDAEGGQAAAKAGKSPIAIMLAQPTIGKNQAMLDVIAPTVGLPAGSSAEEILAADDARNAKAKNKYAPAATTPAAESADRAVDAKGRTQQEWIRLVKAKFPDVKLIQAKMIDGPIQAILSDGRKLSWNKVEKSVEEGFRDPKDWDEGNTEPPNNFAVYINGKKWKIFKGRGQYADDRREQAHYQQLKDWAAKKSASTGKQWTVSITGETATESLNSKVGEGSMFAGAKVGHKEGPAGQWRNDGAKKNKPAKPGDLVGGGM